MASQYEGNFLLKLSGYGDADMLNLFTEDGERIEPWAAKKYPVGRTLIGPMRRYNARYFIPFSSFHCYRRQDSLWAEAYTTPIDAYAEGFDLPAPRCCLPSFGWIVRRAMSPSSGRPPPTGGHATPGSSATTGASRLARTIARSSPRTSGTCRCWRTSSTSCACEWVGGTSPSI
ncbi:hypothetical protein ACN28S_26125 [Cystobacter fuscus]